MRGGVGAGGGGGGWNRARTVLINNGPGSRCVPQIQAHEKEDLRRKSRQ